MPTARYIAAARAVVSGAVRWPGTTSTSGSR